MAIMNAIHQLFSNVSQQPAQPAPPAQQVQQPENTPTSPAPAPTSKPEDSPQAKFSKLWETPATNSDDLNAPIFEGVDPTKLQEAASKVNFVNQLPAEVRAKIIAGGEDSLNAVVDIINRASQMGYAQSAAATTQIVEQALKKQQARLMAQLPSLIKQHQVSDALNADNPLFNDPAFSPVISALKQQLTRQNPEATASEITSMTKEYLGILGKSLNKVLPEPTVQSGTKKSTKTDAVDWTKWIDS